MIISLFSLFLGIVIITLYYSFSSNLKNFYLELKSNYTSDNKYLAVPLPTDVPPLLNSETQSNALLASSFAPCGIVKSKSSYGPLKFFLLD